VGFGQERLIVENGLVSVAVTGLGYDEMRKYPFIYYEDAVVYDFWKNGFPTWISYKPYPVWTETHEMTTYNGPISPENVSMLVKTGDIVEFENLTIYFDDGSSFVCGPQLITMGMNFTQTETGWTIQQILNVSDQSGVTIGDDSITISLRGSVPLHTVFLGLIITVPAVVIVGAVWWRRRRLQSEKSETEESDKTMKGTHIRI
jgi:hypothetical protein